MLGIRSVGKDETPIQSQDAQVLVSFETVVLLVLISQRWGNKLRSLIQPFVAFLGQASFPGSRIALDLRPQRFVGGTHLSGNATGHLSRELEASADLLIGSRLQADFVAHLAMLKSVLAHPMSQAQGLPQARLVRSPMPLRTR